MGRLIKTFSSRAGLLLHFACMPLEPSFVFPYYFGPEQSHAYKT